MILVQKAHEEHCVCMDCLAPAIKEIQDAEKRREEAIREGTAHQLLHVIDARAMQLNYLWPPEVADAIRAWWDAGKPRL